MCFIGLQPLWVVAGGFMLMPTAFTPLSIVSVSKIYWGGGGIKLPGVWFQGTLPQSVIFCTKIVSTFFFPSFLISTLWSIVISVIRWLFEEITSFRKIKKKKKHDLWSHYQERKILYLYKLTQQIFLIVNSFFTSILVRHLFSSVN